MNDAVVIRTARDGDVDALRGVFRRSCWSNEGDRPLLIEHPELLVWDEPAAVAEGRTRLAVIGRAAVGFATVSPTGPVQEIVDLFVDPEHMRRGLGRELIADLIVRAAAAGCTRLEVDANRHAVPFYEKVGFSEMGEVPMEYGTATRMGQDVLVHPHA